VKVAPLGVAFTLVKVAPLGVAFTLVKVAPLGVAPLGARASNEKELIHSSLSKKQLKFSTFSTQKENLVSLYFLM
jgi:hypothetical protein